jgi:signal transduction histidine kinase
VIRLHDLLLEHRDELIHRWTQEARQDLDVPSVSRAELREGMPVFLTELARALRRAVVGPSAAPPAVPETAEEHGRQRFAIGFDVISVAREYGILHRCILESVADRGVEVSLAEHVVLSTFTNEAVAHAVAEYARQRDEELQRNTSNHVAFVAHELRNPLGHATLAFTLLRSSAGLDDDNRLVQTVERNLKRLQRLVDQSLVRGRLTAGVELQRESVNLNALLVEAQQESLADGDRKGVRLAVEADADLVVRVDPRLLRSAVTNLLGNAVKFTHEGGTVILRARRTDLGVGIEVEDECGGLAEGAAEKMFEPHVQLGQDKSGFGLGLAISKQATDAHQGTLRVENLPGKGCMFVLELPPDVMVPKA